ncbi:TetR/AcrR family transcriptional regulator [Chitinophaga tropicalis]|uniref:TetR family transcriptional regulator n=1 Tax=Chitinophaga tropicalis TaxID=2683588 RepID=A0A7K1UDL1_9BACT|nr:TetR/AcrR family transcriptional regulator [Chitinophaga tropicalis]MVT12474.1 TetR family transcriptional regulator [Chitinophaga tropicalis]
MATRDNKTEQHIIDTAMRVFFSEGRLNATTQDIADAAGVNRTLIHYYFRSRDQLFDAVFECARLTALAESNNILSEPIPFRKKIEKFVESFLNRLKTYPYLEMSITTAFNEMKEEKDAAFMNGRSRMKEFLKEIQHEMDKGNIRKTKPVHFMINLFSLLVYPFIVRPLNMQLFGLTEQEYEKIVNERKKVIMDLIFGQ